MNASILQDKLYHQLRMVDAEMLERRAQKLQSYIFSCTDHAANEQTRKVIAELYARADRIRKSLEPKG